MARRLMRKPDVDLEIIRRIATRALPGSGRLAATRAEAGVSTQVYRLRRNDATYYLRVAEEPEASLDPEALVHSLLRERGVQAPEVVHIEAFNEDLGRAVTITTEIPGNSLASCHAGVDIPAILIEAGRDLAVINSLEVEGFGWIKRHRPTTARLEAELATRRMFVLQDVDQHLERLGGIFLTHEEVRTIHHALLRYDDWLDVGEARLAHGDLDATHIYHQHGRYTGIIDFGEIRGASQFYDLGHFAIHDRETVPLPMLPHLLHGYGAAAALPPDHEQRIHLEGLLIGIRALGRSMSRPRASSQDHLTESIRRCLRVLGT